MSDLTLSDIRNWFGSPLGEHVLAEQRAVMDQLLPELFGYHLLQLSVQEQELFEESPIHHKMTMGLSPADHSPFHGKATALPFEDDSMDVVILHHLLDFFDSPQPMLREAARVTIPMGRVLIVGFNPFSSWGVARPIAKLRNPLPWEASFIRAGRLMDWLNLLDFRIDRVHYNTYGLPVNKGSLMGRVPDYTQGLSRKSNLPFGATYVIVARKHVGAMTPFRTEWKPSRALGNLSVVRPTGRSAARTPPEATE